MISRYTNGSIISGWDGTATINPHLWVTRDNGPLAQFMQCDLTWTAYPGTKGRASLVPAILQNLGGVTSLTEVIQLHSQ